MKTTYPTTLGAFALALAFFLTASNAAAHCDTLDGPVVESAKLALAKGDVTPVLKWVNKESEQEVRTAFALALKVRSLGDDAQRLADTHWFETLVRLHRAGEGVPFTGVKPAGTVDPGFVAADKALHDGAVAELSAELTHAIQDGLRKRFAAVLEKKKHADNSVEAGRAYVAAYVEYTHFIEGIHTLTSPAVETSHRLPASEAHR